MNYHDNKDLTYFLYARKSSENEDRQVQSIDDQVKRLRELAQTMGLNIKEVLTEARSAKTPDSRPVFADMIARLENGDAQGILCWQINRLSRNPIDSARIQWLLQRWVIKEIQTIDRIYRPEDNALIFSVESGMANQFILDLQKNTRRGLQSKIEKGWAPVIAPLGYKNDVVEKTIIPDPDRFELIRKMWDLILTGSYNATQVRNIANNEWGFRTPKTKHKGGVPLSNSGVYRIFHNPFYYGMISYSGKIYQGAHQPMITIQEFERAQEILGREMKPRKHTHDFAFTGIISCGTCGCMVTAEEKFKHIKSTGKTAQYVYYRCTKKKTDVVCAESAIKLEDLESQIEATLTQYTIPVEFKNWALEVLRSNHEQETKVRSAIYDSLNKEYRAKQKQLDNLMDLRLRDLVCDEEFMRRRETIQGEIAKMKQKIEENQNRAESWIDTAEKAFNFASLAREKFREGDLRTKREILTAIGQGFELCDGILSFEPSPWLVAVSNQGIFSENGLGWIEPNKKRSIKAKTGAFTPADPQRGDHWESNPV